MASAQTAEQTKLQASTFQRLHPQAYFEKFLVEGVRPDGRTFNGWRDVSVNVGSIGTADGSALVRLGDTTIICGIKAEIASPELDRPDEGFIVPNVDLGAICSSKFKPGPPGEEAQVLSEKLNEILISSEAISLDSLCIHPGKAAWVLYVDVTCINYDGNALDSALLAVIAALKNTRLPKATFNEDTGRTICSRSIKSPLSNLRTPLSFSFGIYDSKHTVSDPTSFEEPLLATSISIVVLNHKGELGSISQAGAGVRGQSQEVVVGCIDQARKRWVAIEGILKGIS